MSGISPKLPLGTDGRVSKFASNITYVEAIKQNFKHLILTIPGEKMMDPQFGVGLIALLFENYDGQTLRDLVHSKIQEQINTYMPFIKIINIQFIGLEESVEADPNAFRMILEYEIPSLAAKDFLDITV
mgnify:FL=1